MQTASGEPAVIGTQHENSTPEIFDYTRLGNICLEVGKIRLTETRSDILKLVQQSSPVMKVSCADLR